MSRTDKDAPYWLRAEWWEPGHYGCQFARFGRARRDCDLPTEPPPRAAKGRRCVWVPSWDPRLLGGPTREFVTLVFRGPERAKVRDTCRRAVAEYRATGEVDVIPQTTQHRHAAHWLFW